MFKRLLLFSFLLALGYFPLAPGAKAGDNPTLDTGAVVVSTSAAIRTITNYLNKKEYNPNQKIDVNYSYQQIPMDCEVQTALLTISQNRLSLVRIPGQTRPAFRFKPYQQSNPKHTTVPDQTIPVFRGKPYHLVSGIAPEAY